jgi:hypothetical protein
MGGTRESFAVEIQTDAGTVHPTNPRFLLAAHVLEIADIAEANTLAAVSHVVVHPLKLTAGIRGWNRGNQTIDTNQAV